MTAKENGTLVSDLGRAFRLGDSMHFADVPAMFKRLMQEKAWQEFMTPTGEIVTHDRFGDFLATPPTRGVGPVSVALVRRILADDKEALDLLDQAVQNPAHVHADVNNINVRPQGTAIETALRRLRRDRPDLHERVLADEMSAHAAMVEAGFRHRTQTVRVDDPTSAARALRRHMTPEHIQQLVKLLSDEQEEGWTG